MDPLLFTTPPFVRLTAQQLKNVDDVSSILSSRESRFLICHQGKCLVVDKNVVCVEGHDLTRQDSERVQRIPLNGVAEDKNLQNRISGTCNVFKQSFLSSVRFHGNQLSALLSKYEVQRQPGNEIVIEESCNALFILLGRDQVSGLTFYACDISYFPTELLISLLPSNCSLSNLREIVQLVHSPSDATALSIAQGLCRYHRLSVYCERCGCTTVIYRLGSCRLCQSCQTISFPRVNPAMLCLVHYFPYCLLGRKNSWPSGRYSCLAGFTEIGESMEQTVAREVMEEASVRIDQSTIHYKGSQPWCFPNSLMFGFHAEASSHMDDMCSRDGNSEEHPDPFHSAASLTQGSLPISTRGGNELPTLRYLPCVYPDDGEMEDVRWVHVDFLRHWMNTCDPERSIATADQEPSIDSSIFHLPPKLCLSRRLIDLWVTSHRYPSAEQDSSSYL